MDDVLGEINIADPTANVDDDEEMVDVAPRAVQKQEKKKADREEKGKEEKKKDKKEKKRKHGEVEGMMDIDGEKKHKKEKKERKHKVEA